MNPKLVVLLQELRFKCTNPLLHIIILNHENHFRYLVELVKLLFSLASVLVHSEQRWIYWLSNGVNILCHVQQALCPVNLIELTARVLKLPVKSHKARS